MRIAIASDHNGVDCKKSLVSYLNAKGHELIDCSVNNNPNDDYPDFAFVVCNEVVDKKAEIGILICGTGIGMSIAANKVKGIICAKVTSVEEAKLSRNHNGANVIALSYKQNIEQLASIIETFIESDIANDARHQRRINKIINYENGAYNEL